MYTRIRQTVNMDNLKLSISNIVQRIDLFNRCPFVLLWFFRVNSKPLFMSTIEMNCLMILYDKVRANIQFVLVPVICFCNVTSSALATLLFALFYFYQNFALKFINQINANRHTKTLQRQLSNKINLSVELIQKMYSIIKTNIEVL